MWVGGVTISTVSIDGGGGFWLQLWGVCVLERRGEKTGGKMWILDKFLKINTK